MYTIYSRGDCAKCDQAKRYLHEHDIDYREIVLTTPEDIKHIKSFLPPAVAAGPVELPVVFKNGEYLGSKNEMIMDHRIPAAFNKPMLFELLNNHICQLVFEKLNGEVIQTRCTLVRDKLPEHSRNMKMSSTGNYLTVYDLDSDSWQGFRIDAVKSINVTGE